jgi:hypothetical protein
MSVCERIAEAITGVGETKKIIEVGPGTGALTQFLMKLPYETSVVEVDDESVAYLNAYYPALRGRIYEEDFLRMDLKERFGDNFCVVGNFPYNISSQILFNLLRVELLIFANKINNGGTSFIVHILVGIFKFFPKIFKNFRNRFSLRIYKLREQIQNSFRFHQLVLIISFAIIKDTQRQMPKPYDRRQKSCKITSRYKASNIFNYVIFNSLKMILIQELLILLPNLRLR